MNSSSLFFHSSDKSLSKAPEPRSLLAWQQQFLGKEVVAQPPPEVDPFSAAGRKQARQRAIMRKEIQKGVISVENPQINQNATSNRPVPQDESVVDPNHNETPNCRPLTQRASRPSSAGTARVSIPIVTNNTYSIVYSAASTRHYFLNA